MHRARDFRLLSRDQLDELPDPQWLIEGLMQVETSIVLYGPSGGGKTFVGLDIGHSVSTGRSYHGRAVLHGAVVYVTSEGLRGLKVRIGALENEYGQRATDFHVMPDQPQLANSSDVGRLIELLKQKLPKPISLIVIDTLARHFVGEDENKAEDISRLVAALDELRRQFRCSTLLIHHTGKSSDDARGSSALRGSADTMIGLKKIDKRRFRIYCDKQKENNEFKAIIFELKPITFRGDDGKLHSTCVPTACTTSPDDHTAGEDRAESVFSADDLRDREKRLVLAFADDMNAEYRSKQLEDKCGLPTATFDRARRELLRAGVLEQTTKGFYKLSTLGKAILEGVKHDEHHQ